jgi:hypothetical protein
MHPGLHLHCTVLLLLGLFLLVPLNTNRFSTACP